MTAMVLMTARPIGAVLEMVLRQLMSFWQWDMERLAKAFDHSCHLLMLELERQSKQRWEVQREQTFQRHNIRFIDVMMGMVRDGDGDVTISSVSLADEGKA